VTFFAGYTRIIGDGGLAQPQTFATFVRGTGGRGKGTPDSTYYCRPSAPMVIFVHQLPWLLLRYEARAQANEDERVRICLARLFRRTKVCVHLFAAHSVSLTTSLK
jgi:hypothetical protein